FYLNLNSSYNVKLSRNRGLATILTAFPGQADHFGWDAISSPQSNGIPFGVAITAQDYWNSTVSNFSSTVALSAAAGGIPQTNSSGLNLVVQTTSTRIPTILANLGKSYDVVGSLSGVDLSRYNTVLIGMDGGSVDY